MVGVRVRVRTRARATRRDVDLSGPRAARALAAGAERLALTSSRIILHLPRLSAAVLAVVSWVDSVPSPHSRASLTSPPAIGAARDASAGRGGAERDCPAAHPGGLGVPNARDTPCPKPTVCPVPPRHRRASSTSPPAIGADRVASAGRRRVVRACGAGPSRVVEALRQGCARAAQAAHVPWATAPPMALRHEPAGEDEQPARRSIVHGACMPPERCR